MEHSASTRVQVRENVIRLAGEFDLCSAARLSEVLAEVLREGSRQLFIDVADVTFMDCSTLSVLLHARRASRRWVRPRRRDGSGTGG